jgi:alkylation response protein AidB-like acyl-CoA dehydrogenase
MHRNIFEEDHEIFRDSVVKFLQAEVTPNLERWLEAGIIDRELFQKAGEQGYCLMWADEAYGGMGVHDFRFEQILIEEMPSTATPASACRCTAGCARPTSARSATRNRSSASCPAASAARPSSASP